MKGWGRFTSGCEESVDNTTFSTQIINSSIGSFFSPNDAIINPRSLTNIPHYKHSTKKTIGISQSCLFLTHTTT